MRKIAIKNLPRVQSGQTLIETVIAIFILVSGIAAAVGLAIFALSNSQNLTRQMVAVGLAREGVEAVKNMRDTNWLKQATIDSDCYNPKSLLNDAKCYKRWLDQQAYPNKFGFIGDNLDPTVSNPSNYVLGFNSDSVDWPNFWGLVRNPTLLPLPICLNTPSFPFNSPRYAMDFFSDPTNDSTYGEGYYRPNCSGTGNSGFYRKIILEKEDGVSQYGSGNENPFNKNTGQRLKVISRVWWTDKKCPVSADWPGLGKCSVELQTYLTNWKNY